MRYEEGNENAEVSRGVGGRTVYHDAVVAADDGHSSDRNLIGGVVESGPMLPAGDGGTDMIDGVRDYFEPETHERAQRGPGKEKWRRPGLLDLTRWFSDAKAQTRDRERRMKGVESPEEVSGNSPTVDSFSFFAMRDVRGLLILSKCSALTIFPTFRFRGGLNPPYRRL